MKTKWLISVEDDALKKVVKSLKRKEINILEILDAIGVIIIEPSEFKMSDIKKIEGVTGVEEERDVHI